MRHRTAHHDDGDDARLLTITRPACIVAAIPCHTHTPIRRSKHVVGRPRCQPACNQPVQKQQKEAQVELSGLYNIVLEQVEKPLIELSLKAFNGNQVKTAIMLGINRNTLKKKIDNYKLKPKKGAQAVVAPIIPATTTLESSTVLAQ